MAITEEQLLQEAKRRGIDISKYAGKSSNPSMMDEMANKGILPGLLNKIAPGVGDIVYNSVPRSSPTASSDPYATEYAKQAARAQFPGASKPTPEQEMQTFKDKETFKASLKPVLPPTEELKAAGLLNIGGKPVEDPAFMDEKEAFELESAKRKERDAAEKAKRELQEAMRAEEAKANLAKVQAQDIYNTASEIEKGSGFFGMMGGMPSYAVPSTYIPGGKTYGDRANWEANIDKLRAGLSLEKIGELRSAGTTGSTGMGVLSDRDINLLTNAATALRRNLEPRDALKYIKDIKDVQAKLLGIVPGGVQQSNQAGSVDSNLDASVNAMLDQLGA